MAHPYPDAPSLKQFVDNATRQGCTEGTVHRTGLKFLETPGGAIATLPDIADEDLIKPEKLAQMVRVLGVTGYEDFLVSRGYGPDGANKPPH